MGLDLAREAPPRAEAGAPATLRYRLRSRARLVPALALTIEELPDDDARSRLGARAVAFLACVRARGVFAARVPHTAIAQGSITPQRRGVVRLSRVRVSTSFPFGLARKSVTFEQPAELLVSPAPADIPARTPQPAGARTGLAPRERRHRAGEEFYALRAYSPGDSLRSVAWRASARAGDLVVRERATRPHPRVALVLREPTDDVARERVLSLAAGLVRRAARAGEEFSLRLEAGPSLLAPGAGPRQVRLSLDALSALPDRDWSRAARGPADAGPEGGLLVHAGDGPTGVGIHDPGVSFPRLAALGHPPPPPPDKVWWRSLLGDGE
jgi:uncharacterized protein (DUF58 family)